MRCGERTIECKTVLRRGKQTRYPNSICVKITVQHSGLKFKEESRGRNAPTETTRGQPSQERKPVLYEELSLEPGKQEVPTKKSSLEQDHSHRKSKLQSNSTNMESRNTESVHQDYSLANSFFICYISDPTDSGLAWQICIVLSYP